MDNGVEREATAAEEEEIRALQTAHTARVVPKEVSRRQGLQALAIAGLLDLVQPLIDRIEDPLDRQLAQIEFLTSQVFERDRPLIEQMRPGLGLTPSQLDDLFVFAKTIP
jgi:hypothetical protein